MYNVKHGETISDVVINATGNMSNYETILNLNGFNTWTPDLTSSLNVPGTSNMSITNKLAIYPACNNSIVDLDIKINDIIETLEAAVMSAHTLPPAPVVLLPYHTIKYGESISDIVINATGSILDYETILKNNSFNDWTPDLTIGEKILLAGITQDNVQRVLIKYPACNNSNIDVNAKIQDFVNIFVTQKLFEDDTIALFEDGINYNFE